MRDKAAAGAGAMARRCDKMGLLWRKSLRKWAPLLSRRANAASATSRATTSISRIRAETGAGSAIQHRSCEIAR